MCVRVPIWILAEERLRKSDKVPKENGETRTKKNKQNKRCRQNRNNTRPAHDKGKNPSCSLISSLTRFSSCSLATEDFLLFALRSFCFRCTSRHLLPLEQVPVTLNSSHSSVCFFLHYKKEHSECLWMTKRKGEGRENKRTEERKRVRDWKEEKQKESTVED